MKTTLCYEMTDLAVKLEQTSINGFTVTYGNYVHDHLNYTQARIMLGACIMQAIALSGKISFGEKFEALEKE